MKRLERFAKLVDDAVHTHSLVDADAQRAKAALLQSAYLTALSSFSYQLGDSERNEMQSILERHGVALPPRR